MPNIVSTLGIGELLIMLVFGGIYMIGKFTGRQLAVILTLLIIAVYTPYSIMNWYGADVFAIHIAIYIVTAWLLGVVAGTWEDKKARAIAGQPLKFFHWGPALIFAFFATIIAMDSVFVTLAGGGLKHDVGSDLLPESKGARGAVSSFFPGTVAHDYQEKENQFNEYQEQLERQKIRGWQVRKGFMVDPVVNVPLPFRVQVSDINQQPVNGAKVWVKFMRLSDARKDVMFELQPFDDQGAYQGVVELSEHGRWQALIHIEKGDDIHEIKAFTSISPAL